jgi:GT2 family glycosyltransferase
MKLNFLQIHDFDLNISKRLNECVSLLPNEWIVLTDNDVLKFPTFANNLKEILKEVNELDLIGSTTNRLNPNNPQVIKELFDESDINKHFDYSVEAWTNYGPELQETKIIAGSCFIFHKKLWEKVGGFDENKTFFDKYFSYEVPKVGGRCLIAKGLYTLHLYRWGTKSPVDSVEHLIK